MTLHQLRSMPVSPPRAEPYNKPDRVAKEFKPSDFHSPVLLLLLLWIFLNSIELRSRYTVAASRLLRVFASWVVSIPGYARLAAR